MTDISAFAISKEIQAKIRDKAWLHNQLTAKKNIQEILGFSDAIMDQFYMAACTLVQNRRYEDAINAFLFLVTLNPDHYDYWLGLGTATQWCGEYETAVDAYEMAAICHLDDPVPYFHLSRCLFAMHDRESALQAIELAIEYSADRYTFEDLHRQALAAKALLLKEMR